MKEIRNERKRPTQRRRRRIAAVLVPAALLSVAATSYAVLNSDEVVASGIGCYGSVSESDSDVAIVSTTGGDPIRVCEDLWARGDIGTSSENVPAMTACINSGGAVAVFPTGDNEVCTHLGLQPLPEGYRDAARRFAKMRDDVYRQLYNAGTAGGVDEKDVCLDEGTSLQTVTSVLEKHRFDDWTAEIAQGDYRDRTCMNVVAFDDKVKTVLIIPAEPGMIPWHLHPTM
ncbi:MAG TPA: hypothetical protein VNC78_01975 [Actinomycetota bacterium]|nr:hypothetical protein [Actinomycetota bacterium]